MGRTPAPGSTRAQIGSLSVVTDKGPRPARTRGKKAAGSANSWTRCCGSSLDRGRETGGLQARLAPRLPHARPGCRPEPACVGPVTPWGLERGPRQMSARAGVDGSFECRSQPPFAQEETEVQRGKPLPTPRRGRPELGMCPTPAPTPEPTPSRRQAEQSWALFAMREGGTLTM